MTIKLKAEGDAPDGKIQSYDFPSSPIAGKEYSNSIVVLNIGGTGVYGCGVVNQIGNPGLITIKSGDASININQGEYLRTYKTGPYGDLFTAVRKIIFSVPGTYQIPLWNMYQLADGWYYTVETVLAITVKEEVIVEEPALWDRFKEYAAEHPLTVAVGFGSVIVAGGAYAGGVVGRRKKG